MMSKQAQVQSPSFSIRFRPASIEEHEDELSIAADDTCNVGDGSQMHNGSCEAVLFERVSNTDELAPSSESADSSSAQHPSSLWKNSQELLSRSAPVSVLASPVSPSAAISASSVTHEKPNAGKPVAGSQPLVEKLSIFSGLREKLDRLSSESKEIFDRKMKRSGSADAAKIASLLADPDVTKSNAMKNEASCENSDTGSVQKSDVGPTDKQKVEVNEQTAHDDSMESAHSSNSLRKSTSSFEVTTGDSVLTPATKLKRASLGDEGVQQPVVMSRLMSSSSLSFRGGQLTATDASMSLSPKSFTVDEQTHHTTDARHFLQKPKRFIFTARFRYLFSFMAAVVAYIIIPMPSYVSGMVVGAILSAVGILLYQRLTRSRQAEPTLSRDVRSSTLITAEVRESNNMEGKFQVCITLDSIIPCILCAFKEQAVVE